MPTSPMQQPEEEILEEGELLEEREPLEEGEPLEEEDQLWVIWYDRPANQRGHHWALYAGPAPDKRGTVVEALGTLQQNDWFVSGELAW